MFELLLAIHVVSVILWIGGVGFVTAVFFPAMFKMEDSLQKVLMFQRIEGLFAKQAKVYIVVAGLSGFGLLYVTGRWSDLFTTRGIDVTLMLVTWTIFALVLTFEKKVFSFLFGGKKDLPPEKVFLLLTVFHWVLLLLGLSAAFAGVLVGHG